MDRTKIRRMHAAWIAGGCGFLLAVIPALSSTVFRNVHIGDRGVLELVDAILINWVLPLVALGLSLTVTWGMTREERERQFVDPNKMASVVLFPYWKFLMRWFIPGVIALAFLLQIIDVLRAI
jgi:NSS family neurotransmitter:Na+ symporter